MTSPGSTSLTSLWRDRAPIETDEHLEERYDDLVVGAGLTGLVAALLLARAGRHVAVAEAREVGAVTTGNTTGKVSLLHLFFIWVRWTLPRFRYDQLMRLGWVFFFEIALVNIFIAALIVAYMPQ